MAALNLERMPHELEGFAKEKPSPIRTARAALGSLLQPARGSRTAYATLGQDSDGELEDELEDIDGCEHESAEYADGQEDYWAMQRAGDCATFFNLCNTSLGIGILSFSLAFAMGGIVSTTCFLAVAGFLSCASNVVIVRACAHYRQISFQGLVRVALGSRLERAVSAAMVVYCFGTCAGYLNVIGDYSAAVMHEWSSVPDSAPECLFPSEWWCSRVFLMPTLCTAIVLPLALLPTLEALANASFLGICSIGLMAGSVGYRGMASYDEGGGFARHGLDGGPVLLSTTMLALLRTTGIIIFAFSNQAQVPNLFAELAPPPNLPAGIDRSGQEAARVARMQKLLVAGSITMAAFCFACGLGGYVHFGDRVESNVLEPFSLDDQLINVARLAMVLVASVSYPVIHFTARLMLHDLSSSSAAVHPENQSGSAVAMSDSRRWWFSCVFFAAALTLALLTSDLGELFTIFGSLCGWATLFAVPGALLLDRAGPWAASPVDETQTINGVSCPAFICGWLMILGGGFLCGLCLVLDLLHQVAVVCDEQQTQVVAQCVARCASCLGDHSNTGRQPGLAGQGNCTEFCPLEHAFKLAEECLFQGVASAKDVLEAACIES